MREPLNTSHYHLGLATNRAVHLWRQAGPEADHRLGRKVQPRQHGGRGEQQLGSARCSPLMRSICAVCDSDHGSHDKRHLQRGMDAGSQSSVDKQAA